MLAMRFMSELKLRPPKESAVLKTVRHRFSAKALKLEAQAKLHYARAAATETRVALGHVGRLRDDACGTGVGVD